MLLSVEQGWIVQGGKRCKKRFSLSVSGCLSPRACVCAPSKADRLCSTLQGALVQVQAAEGVPVRKGHLPSREQQIQALQSGGEFDVLVIGGGATGCGCALDAATRGKSSAAGSSWGTCLVTACSACLSEVLGGRGWVKLVRKPLKLG